MRAPIRALLPIIAALQLSCGAFKRSDVAVEPITLRVFGVSQVGPEALPELFLPYDLEDCGQGNHRVVLVNEVHLQTAGRQARFDGWPPQLPKSFMDKLFAVPEHPLVLVKRQREWMAVADNQSGVLRKLANYLKASGEREPPAGPACADNAACIRVSPKRLAASPEGMAQGMRTAIRQHLCRAPKLQELTLLLDGPEPSQEMPEDSKQIAQEARGQSYPCTARAKKMAKDCAEHGGRIARIVEECFGGFCPPHQAAGKNAIQKDSLRYLIHDLPPSSFKPGLVTFDSNKSGWRSEGYKKTVLEALLEPSDQVCAKEYFKAGLAEKFTFMLIGRGDHQGTQQTNIKISNERTQSVMQALREDSFKGHVPEEQNILWTYAGNQSALDDDDMERLRANAAIADADQGRDVAAGNRSVLVFKVWCDLRKCQQGGAQASGDRATGQP